MPNKIKFFVEGIADKVFIYQYIKHIAPTFDIEFDDIVSCEGCTNNEDLIKKQMQKNMDDSGKNLVIFDADADFTGKIKDISSRYQFLIEKIFLLPNNKDIGDLESLLEQIICDKNKDIFSCWNRYETCLQNIKIEGRCNSLTVPAKKTKIYAYLEALLGPTRREKNKIKEKEREYNNTDHWNLDSNYLKSLKDFLLVYLKNYK